MSKLQSQYIDLTNPFAFSGDVEVPTPITGPQAANKTYVDAAVVNAASVVPTFGEEEVTYTDTVNMSIALSNPSIPSYNMVVALVIGGSALDYGIDYTVRKVNTTSYICLSPSSAPSSGSFNGGDPSNPSPGVANIIQSGEKLKILYSAGGFQGVALGYQGVSGPQGPSGGPQGTTGVQGLTGPTGLQGPIADNPGISASPTGTTTDSFAPFYTSAVGDIATITAEIVNTGSHSLTVHSVATLFDGTILTNNFVIANGAYADLGTPDLIAGVPVGQGQGLSSLVLSAKSTASGQATTYNAFIRGVGVNVAGPQGTAGVQGVPGVQGVTGAPGGPQGLTGPQGVRGVPGTSDGLSLWNTAGVAHSSSTSFVAVPFASSSNGGGGLFTTLSTTTIQINQAGKYLVSYYITDDGGEATQAQVTLNAVGVTASNSDNSQNGAYFPPYFAAQRTFFLTAQAGDTIQFLAKTPGHSGTWTDSWLTMTPIGAVGAQGAMGAQGATGSTGLTGSGVQGKSGVQGASGTAGVQGTTGSNGVQGPSTAGLIAYCTSQLDKTSDTTLTNPAGMLITLAAGQTYAFEIELDMLSNATGGIRLDLNGGTCTATNCYYNITCYTTNTVPFTFYTNNNNLAFIHSIGSQALFRVSISGIIVVSSGGTFGPRFGQGTSDSTTESVYVGSWMSTGGATGFQGATGAGVQGTTGSTGVQGTTGSTGVQGATGSGGARLQHTNSLKFINPNTSTETMLGFGAGGATITPSSTGNILIMFCGDLNTGGSGQAGSETTINIRYGTGTAPATGDAATGTVVGPSPFVGGYGTNLYSASLMAYASGLSIGTAYWVDIGWHNNGFDAETVFEHSAFTVIEL